ESCVRSRRDTSGSDAWSPREEFRGCRAWSAQKLRRSGEVRQCAAHGATPNSEAVEGLEATNRSQATRMISHPPLMTRTPKLLSSLTPSSRRMTFGGANGGVRRRYAYHAGTWVKIALRTPRLGVVETLKLAPHLGDFRLQFGVGVLPQIDELQVIASSLLAIALRFPQLTEPLVRSCKKKSVGIEPFQDRMRVDVPREHGDRRIG